MGKILEPRTKRHKIIAVSAALETPTISENKPSQCRREDCARVNTVATQLSGNSVTAEVLNRDILELTTEVKQNKLGVGKEACQFVSQTIQVGRNYGGKAKQNWKRISTKLVANEPDIEKDQAAIEQLHKLRVMVERLGGKLDGGWQVTSQRRSKNGSPFYSFISPSKEKFRSRVEVVRHLGLPAIQAKSKFPLKRDRTCPNNQLALVPYQRRKKSSIKPSKIRLLNVDEDHVPLEKVLNKPHTSKEFGDMHVTRIPDFSASTITHRCQDILRSIISTKSFAFVSNMISWGAPSPSMDLALQIKGPSFLASSLDLKLINLRLSTGVYEQNPELFSTDIQQVWKNIIATGNELVSLASSLAELSECLYKQQILSLFEGISQKAQHSTSIGNQGTMDDTYAIVSFPVTLSAKGPDNTSLRGLTADILVKDPVNLDCLQSGYQATQAGLRSPLLSRQTENPARYDLRKQLCKRSRHEKELFPSQGGLSCSNSDSDCHNCVLNKCKEPSVCNYCKAPCYPNCVVPSSVPSGGCCTLCFLTQAAENACEWEGHGNGTAVNEGTPKDLFFMNSNTTKAYQGFQANVKGGICEACNIDDDNVLLCDACDAAYHMNCLTPPIQSVPDGYWYCPQCDEAGKNIMVFQQDVDLHNCSVCERVSRELVNCTANESTAQVLPKNISLAYVSPELSTEYGCHNRSPNQGLLECAEKNFVDPVSLSLIGNVCKLCRLEGEKLSISCSNCQSYYHLSCLKPPLRKRPHKTWYCPSCLCRVCKIDIDDDKILLCDSCDEGFHTYCLTPPLLKIPQEAWFCCSCMEARPSYS